MVPILFSLAVAALLYFLSQGNAASAGERRITAAAASDLNFAFKDIAAVFEKETGIKVILSFGSTGMLAKQISGGAPFDIFFAADMKYLKDLSGKGHIISSSVERYALGVVVLAVNKSSGIEVRELKDLLKPEIRNVAIANPDHAPYGRAAMEALKSAGLRDKLKDKLVYGENIRQTLQFIQTGNAQAGIVALSLVNVPEITYVRIDTSLHNPIDQAVGIVKTSKNPEAAASFIRYVKGPVGSEVMKKYGFIMTH
ncbi:MAG: molybdate ABC transporter substrate-binding protein [Nitrospirae bacterium RIFCSPLOW2_12_42_9]|nr:MAG: molybdate ABC transporter substrate-binding protein [Nitrospirae bacterium RIFCSPLOW2_12_42_9]